MSHDCRKFLGALATSALFGVSLTAGLSGNPLLAQMGAMGQQGMMQEKLAAIKASTAENQRKLHQYTWTETSRITVNGNARPAKESTCSYGTDGKVRKVPMGGTEEASSNMGGRRGRFRQRIVEKKTEEMKDYMQQVAGVIALYMPPNPMKMQQAFQLKKISFGRSSGLVNLVFKDYALPGDSMTIGFDSAAKKIRTLNVNTYLNQPQDGITLMVEFAGLPDGTNHPQRTTLDAQAKKIHVVNTNSNYRKTYQ